MRPFAFEITLIMINCTWIMSKLFGCLCKNYSNKPSRIMFLERCCSLLIAKPNSNNIRIFFRVRFGLEIWKATSDSRRKALHFFKDYEDWLCGNLDGCNLNKAGFCHPLPRRVILSQRQTGVPQLTCAPVSPKTSRNAPVRTTIFIVDAISWDWEICLFWKKKRNTKWIQRGLLTLQKQITGQKYTFDLPQRHFKQKYPTPRKLLVGTIRIKRLIRDLFSCNYSY